MAANEDSDVSERDALNKILQGKAVQVELVLSGYEYIVLDLPKKLSDRIPFLDAVGTDGWRLVTVVDRQGYFERPL